MTKLLFETNIKKNNRLVFTGLLFCLIGNLALSPFSEVFASEAQDYGVISSSLNQAVRSAAYMTCQWVSFNEESRVAVVNTFLSPAGHPETRQLELNIDSKAMIFDGERAILLSQIPENSLVDIEFDPKSNTAQFVLLHPSSE